MVEIIKFPGSNSLKNSSNADLVLDKLPKTKQQCNITDTTFTCTGCGNKMKFSFKGIIFKETSFFCNHCGDGFMLSNPLFGKIKNE